MYRKGATMAYNFETMDQVQAYLWSRLLTERDDLRQENHHLQKVVEETKNVPVAAGVAPMEAKIRVEKPGNPCDLPLEEALRHRNEDLVAMRKQMESVRARNTELEAENRSLRQHLMARP
jgi:regulator of replication initiation timing